MKLLSQNKLYFFNFLFCFISLFVFVVVALRSYFVPFNHDEAGTFFMFIQSGKYLPFHSQIDANNHVLNSFLGNISFHLFGSSPFALRLPNLLGLLVLILATYQISLRFKQLGSKVFLMAAILLSFHWLSFFSACRGYGLSMALLLMGLSYVLNYLDHLSQNKNLILCLLFFQLAISSNLILIIVVLLLSGVVVILQLVNKVFFKSAIIFVWIIHLVFIYYWLSFSFYLQQNGALYYGEGDSYWKVTFVSLIDLLVGFYNPVVKYGLVILFLGLLLFPIYINRQAFNLKLQFQKPSLSLLFAFVFIMLCIAFYAMHMLLGVNYPEDRTGLFFYVFFVLWMAFTFDEIPSMYNKIITLFLSGLFLAHFTYNLNFRKHSLNVYETIPEHFYTTLLNEQKKSKERITIGGHRVRELFYAFLNYRHHGGLNPADPTEVMQMNCDYYIATKKEEKYFMPYYDIIDTEPDWGFVILKRKEKIRRNLVTERKDILLETNESEFLGIYDRGDTAFSNSNPIIAEIKFDVIKISNPTNTWIVLAVNDSLDQQYYFKRYPLQWTGYDLSDKKGLTYSLVTGNLPPKFEKLVCFIWNIDKKPFSIKVNSVKMYQLEGKGVDYEAPGIK